MQRVTVGENVLFHQFDDEGVILNITNETYYRLDTMAMSMWLALTQNENVEAAKQALLAEYDVAPEVLEADLMAFVQRLTDAQLVIVDA